MAFRRELNGHRREGRQAEISSEWLAHSMDCWVVKEAGKIQLRLFMELWKLNLRLNPSTEVCYLTVLEISPGLVANAQSWNHHRLLRRTRH